MASEELRSRVRVARDAPAHTSSYSAMSPARKAKSEAESAQVLQDSAAVNVLSSSDEEVVFELSGVDPSIANALRRVMMAEVETMAIEYVFISNNTSVMNDEVLSHRLGLLPIVAPVEFFGYFEKKSDDLSQDFTDTNTLKFTLDVTCKVASDGEESGAPAAAAYTSSYQPRGRVSESAAQELVHGSVFSGDFKFVPEGVQKSWIEASPELTPRMAFEDILVCKMRPGQQIKLECFATKGVGKEHAKWSPVSPASYRLLPDIRLNDEAGNPRVLDDEADELKEICPMDVFDIEDLGNGSRAAVAARPLFCTMCRECIRPNKFVGKVDLGRKKDHFIFSVESTHVIPAPEIVRRGLDVLSGKCSSLREEIAKMKSHEDDA